MNEIVMTAILNETTSNKKKSETNVHISTIDSFDHVARSFIHAITSEMSQVKTFKKSKIEFETIKKRKIIENEFLHFDLQILIISNFLVVNSISENDVQ